MCVISNKENAMTPSWFVDNCFFHIFLIDFSNAIHRLELLGVNLTAQVRFQDALVRSLALHMEDRRLDF